jgi:uncharacterized protein YjbI with pentapeptide repeats
MIYQTMKDGDNVKFKIEQPKILVELLETKSIRSLESKDEISNGVIESTTIESQDAIRVSMDKMIFRNVTITESSLEQIELTDIVFENCDFSNVNFSSSFMHRIEFRNCKLIGTSFSQSRFQNVRFLDCLGDFSNFRFATFKQAGFEAPTIIILLFKKYFLLVAILIRLI